MGQPERGERALPGAGDVTWSPENPGISPPTHPPHTHTPVGGLLPSGVGPEGGRDRCNKMVPGVAGKKIKWTEEEDQMLRDLVEKHGTKKWSFISTLFENKGSKQCRRRWQNKLSMDAKNTSWTDEEDDILLKVKNSLCRRPVRTRRGPPRTCTPAPSLIDEADPHPPYSKLQRSPTRS